MAVVFDPNTNQWINVPDEQQAAQQSLASLFGLASPLSGLMGLMPAGSPSTLAPEPMAEDPSGMPGWVQPAIDEGLYDPETGQWLGPVGGGLVQTAPDPPRGRLPESVPGFIGPTRSVDDILTRGANARDSGMNQQDYQANHYFNQLAAGNPAPGEKGHVSEAELMREAQRQAAQDTYYGFTGNRYGDKARYDFANLDFKRAQQQQNAELKQQELDTKKALGRANFILRLKEKNQTLSQQGSNLLGRIATTRVQDPKTGAFRTLNEQEYDQIVARLGSIPGFTKGTLSPEPDGQAQQKMIDFANQVFGEVVSGNQPPPPAAGTPNAEGVTAVKQFLETQQFMPPKVKTTLIALIDKLGPEEAFKQFMESRSIPDEVKQQLIAALQSGGGLNG